ncbi:hypothetical protein BOTBODRAFT_35307 [Botryobasidium botryosum FD-172 SS1]|uniref:tripeptidyl-peptidase II n=1 Tax=Botryobasidium botryosum (strain FD-172 SS1) TaxID=930990 RepID=A0A067MIN5_BOTB1|nr:hypothetical protein BOTBODRAFT_35307 [Botryobasidium botryosum FD-172 SS1]
MRFLPLFFPLLLLATAEGASITHRLGSYTTHEARRHAPSGWSKRGGLNKRATIPVRINLKQGNLNQAEKLLMAVSHPDSPNYGQHYSAKEVADLFAPSRESIDAVKDWLISAGLHPHRLQYSHPKGAVLVDMAIEEIEDLLQTEYDIYEHESGQPHVACDSYSVPQAIQNHIDFITPTVHFDAKVAKRDDSDQPFKAFNIGDLKISFITPKIQFANLLDIFKQQAVKNCDKQTTPACLQALYGYGKYQQRASMENSLGIVEYTPQSYLPTDLDLFSNMFSNETKGYRPDLVSIDGGVLINTTSPANLVESSLDLQYAISIVYPTNTTLYQVGDPVKRASFNNFLGGLDATYCEALDPVHDAVYSPPSCGSAKPTNVISTSYSYNEADLTLAYEQRQCMEYMKLGMQGVTVIFSSGDYGVAGSAGVCIDPATGNRTVNGTRFNPSFPSTCPYVTSIGATQVNNGSSVYEPESACQQHAFSGGGFSNRFPIPDYQKQAVGDYFAKYTPPYTAAQYNNSGATRGYPDISANGANYVVAVAGKFGMVAGTSASAPVVASILTLINDARLAAGQPTIGFINPFIYAHPEMFNDITSGGNQGCGTPGFTAVPGWDPVTGLGTPNFPKMLDKFMGGKDVTLGLSLSL